MWTREALWTRFGLTLETAWALWTPQHFHDVMKFLEIQGTVQGQRSRGDPDVTQATFEHLRRERDARREEGGGDGERGSHDPAAAGGG